MENNITGKHICLAVLPLQVLSDNPKVTMICQGLLMDLITDLSRFRSFRIIAYDTSKGIDPNEQTDSTNLNELNLDYLVKGMARHQDEKVLFNLQLVNFRQNRLAWAEKFSGGFDELLQIQEEIVEKIVMSLQHFVDYDLLNEVRKKPLTDLNVYECWLRGYQELKKGILEADEQARLYFRQAME
jgi:TolB-like protein